MPEQPAKRERHCRIINFFLMCALGSNMGIQQILVQDEDGDILHFLRQGDITLEKNSQSAIARLKEQAFNLVICDCFEVLKASKALHPAVPVVLMTALSSVDNAVEAMRLGAFDYLQKPISPE